MTKFQALFVLWLRHEDFCGCSWRALAAHYFNRYDSDGKLLEFKDRINFKIMTYGCNQIDGMVLKEEAFRVLRENSLFKEPMGLYEYDLTLINANLKNHIR